MRVSSVLKISKQTPVKCEYDLGNRSVRILIPLLFASRRRSAKISKSNLDATPQSLGQQHLKISVAERYLDTIGMTETNESTSSSSRVGVCVCVCVFVGTCPKFLQVVGAPRFPLFFSTSRRRVALCESEAIPESAAARNDDGFFDPPSRRLHAA